MKKLISILSIALFIATVAPSCSSQDESFEEIVLNSDLDQTTTDDGSGSIKPGGN